jgi:hypothetical protein
MRHTPGTHRAESPTAASGALAVGLFDIGSTAIACRLRPDGRGVLPGAGAVNVTRSPRRRLKTPARLPPIRRRACHNQPVLIFIHHLSKWNFRFAARLIR